MIEFVVSDNAGGVIANKANIRLVNYGMMALISSVKLETSSGRTIEYIDHCHPNLLMYKLFTKTDDEYEGGFVRNQGNSDSQFKGNHAAAERGHMYMMVKMSDLFGFVNDLEKLYMGADAVANDGNIDIRDISWCVPSIDPSNDNKLLYRKD